ncbi:hypothetical protein BGLY_4220 [Bacillus glycinifermentans]|nr:hypothetical protein BGLY_4220 [Bacillus glycinifermentans]
MKQKIPGFWNKSGIDFFYNSVIMNMKRGKTKKKAFYF